jgi:hypothetical protein
VGSSEFFCYWRRSKCLEYCHTWTCNRGFNNVFFEIDSKIIADAMYHNRTGVSEFSSLVSNIKDLLSFNSNFGVKFIKQQTNIFTHTLVRATIFSTSCCLFGLYVVFLYWLFFCYCLLSKIRTPSIGCFKCLLFFSDYVYLEYKSIKTNDELEDYVFHKFFDID